MCASRSQTERVKDEAVVNVPFVRGRLANKILPKCGTPRHAQDSIQVSGTSIDIPGKEKQSEDSINKI